MDPKIDDLIGCAYHLPPSPRLLVKLLELYKQPDQDVHEVVRLISQDPPFTVKVLNRCNSVYFSRGEPARDVFEAVSRLGFHEIYRIVLAMFAMSAILRPGGGHGINVEALWRHSFATAVGAEVFAMETAESDAAAFTAALLHDLGKVVMVSADKERYLKAVFNAGQSRRPLVMVEKELFGFDHGEVGARLLEKWNLPPDIVAAARHHHGLAGAEPHERLAAVVFLANLLSHGTLEEFGLDEKRLAKVTASGVPAMDILQLTPERVATLVPVMRDRLENARALMGR